MNAFNNGLYGPNTTKKKNQHVWLCRLPEITNFFEKKGGMSSTYVYKNEGQRLSLNYSCEKKQTHYKTVEKILLHVICGLLDLRFLSST